MIGNGGLLSQGKPNLADWPISGKIAKMALFNTWMEFKFFGGQMTSFEVVTNIC